MSDLRSTSIWFRPAMALAVAAVFLLAYLDLRREQARALDDFSSEQATLARASAAAVEARIAGVLRELDLARVAAGTASAPALLEGIVDVRGPCLEVDAIDRSGRALVEIAADRAPRIATTPSLATERDAALARVARGEGVVISAPVLLAGDRLRLFAAPSDAGAIVLLVDADRFFDGILQLPTPEPARWLVVDDAGRFVDFGPRDREGAAPSDRERASRGGVTATVGRLLAAMQAGGEGAWFLGRPDAASLGLEPRSAVAGFAPIRIGPLRPWSIAVVASAMRVRDRARTAAWRLAAATGLAGLIVALFGVALARQDRRAQRLAGTLRLTAATAALRERSEKLVEAIPLGVLALDERGRVTATNPYLAERGVHPGSDLRAALAGAGPDEVAPLESLLAEARASRRPVERRGLRLCLGSDGNEPRDVDAYAVPLGAPLPDADRFLVLHDRTEVRALERSLVRAEKLATIGTLAAGVAHEVGTPLGIISGRAEQLLARLPDGEASEPTRRGLSSILAQVDKVSTTIRQLLDFARARPIEAVAVTPTELLEGAAALLEHYFRRAGVSLAVDAPAQVPAVAADPGQLEQVLVNLLMNAADACESGGRVVARAVAQGDRVRLEIADDGCGIPPEHLQSVLDPFFTTKKRGHGTGLGLTIAADIVRNHGGTLEIDSAPGRGTTIRVTLPRARRDEPKGTP